MQNIEENNIQQNRKLIIILLLFFLNKQENDSTFIIIVRQFQVLTSQFCGEHGVAVDGRSLEKKKTTANRHFSFISL